VPFAQLTNANLHYYEYGTGPQRVVLIHGFEASARIWQLVQEDLSPEQYHTIAIDNRGAGESSAPDDASDYGVGIFASDALELIDQLGWSDFTLVGHSLGGATACIMALQRPELVKGLMLLDPVDPDGRTETPEEIDVFFDAWATQRRVRLAAAVAADDDADASDASDDDRGESDFIRLLNADMAAAPDARLRGSLHSMCQLGLGSACATLAMPILVACGDADDTIPISAMLATWAKFPKGTGLHVWHGAGHSPNMDMPGRFARVLGRFINKTIPRHQGR